MLQVVMAVDPCLAARDAENVTQNVTAVIFLIYEYGIIRVAHSN
jgi:hypothetical protein